MKKLLYITVNSKPEALSASKTVGKAFVNGFLAKHSDFQVEELDLYETHIPRLEYEYFEKRNCLICEEDFKKLPEASQKEVHRIVELIEQFKSADVYVIAAPMWSLSFPSPLKEYMDCIITDGKTIRISEDKIEGLLDDKPRSMVYVQSSGGKITLLNSLFLNKGLHYIKDIMKVLGITKFQELLVDGTGTTQKEKESAIESALTQIDSLIHNIG